MRARDKELEAKWGTICTPLQMLAPDGKMRKTQAANTEGILRIIQSIPSPKAEPFKHGWQKSVQKDWKKLRILRKQWNVQLLHIKQKGIQINGFHNVSEPLRLEKN